MLRSVQNIVYYIDGKLDKTLILNTALSGSQREENVEENPSLGCALKHCMHRNCYTNPAQHAIGDIL